MGGAGCLQAGGRGELILAPRERVVPAGAAPALPALPLGHHQAGRTPFPRPLVNPGPLRLSLVLFL